MNYENRKKKLYYWHFVVIAHLQGNILDMIQTECASASCDKILYMILGMVKDFRAESIILYIQYIYIYYSINIYIHIHI